MPATAAPAHDTAPPVSMPIAGIAQDAAAREVPEIQALIDSPEDGRALDSFLRVLGTLDATAPRGDDLNAALIAAVSAPVYDALLADIFAQTSLRAEIAQAVAQGEDRLSLPPATLSLIIALLHHRRICCVVLEDVLKSVRKDLLELARTGAPVGDDQMRLAEAMARHSFLNEYIWDDTETERTEVAKLERKLSEEIETGAAVSAFELFLIGAYCPLNEVEAVADWVRALGQRDLAALDPTLRLLVFDRLLEDAIEIEALTPITSAVSKDVQTQYEENPYPRWRYMPEAHVFHDVETYVSASVGRRLPRAADPQARPKVLIAGTGTGTHPISLAQTMPNAAMLGIDLSRASLAYATREATVRDARNLSFAQADILKLADVDVEFDLIESVGVLHHMEDPEAGLRALLSVLKPGGYLRLALYSQTARRAVNVARERFAAAEHEPGLDGIRAFRRAMVHTADPELVSLRTIPDFYTASEFRDLVMHVQEHQFTIPQISGMLKRNGLKFLGFAGASARAALGAMPPKMAERRVRDLETWHRFEERNPDTFIGMYDFFCVKR